MSAFKHLVCSTYHATIHALLFETRLPYIARLLQKTDDADTDANTVAQHPKPADYAFAFPLAGLIIGLLYCVFFGIALWLGFSPTIAIILMLALGLFCAGALHEDGLADMFDGFWGGHDAANRLEIMKDSRIGTYGVLALIVNFALQWALYLELFYKGGIELLFLAILIGQILSRIMMIVLWADTPNARMSGLAFQAGSLHHRDYVTSTLIICALLALSVIIFVSFASLVWVAILVSLCFYAFRRLMMDKINGHSGDCLGAMQICSLIVTLTALTLGLQT